MSREGSNKKPNPGNIGNAQKKTSTQSNAVVPRGTREAATVRTTDGGRSGALRTNNSTETMIVPKGYTMRKIEPAKNYDVISMARAMNSDFGPKVKQLFDIEREAAIEAAETGIYIGWRCPDFTWDCQRVGRSSRCFCGHILSQHDKYNGNSVRVPCKQAGCKCKAYAWIPARPEEIGEFWFARRRDFDVTTWRAKCRCKHTHEDHDPNGMRSCKLCRCGAFDSSFCCAACDKHWEEHETFFDTTASRKEKKMPYGADYLPFSEIPSLRNMVLTGEDDGDMSYLKIRENFQDIPSNSRAIDNNTEYPAPRGNARNTARMIEDRPSRHHYDDDDDDDDVVRMPAGRGDVRGSRGRDDDDDGAGRGGRSKGSGKSGGFKPVYD